MGVRGEATSTNQLALANTQTGAKGRGETISTHKFGPSIAHKASISRRELPVPMN